MTDKKSIKSSYSVSQGNQRSSNSMKIGKNLEPIPTDLILEILSRLPRKSIGRFLCVSKLWGSMLGSPYFKELFMTRSLAHPRLLFAVEGNGEWLFYSSPQPQNPYENSSLVVAADYHTNFRGWVYRKHNFGYASGLIYFPEGDMPLICNPITGKYVTLPETKSSRSYLGFDPIDKQFKILAESDPFWDQRGQHKTLTLGTGKLRWRNNDHCPRSGESVCEGICINGVLYYLAVNGNDDYYLDVIVCFDVRSEKFKLIESECIVFFDELINYKGNLCGIEKKKNKNKNKKKWYDDINKLHMWVLEDVENHEWSKYVYSLPEHEFFGSGYLSIAGATATGEIVFYNKFMSKGKPFYVFYFNPERNTLLRVEIQGVETRGSVETRGRVYLVVDYVEDLSIEYAKLLKSSIYEEEAQPKYHYQKRPKPQHREEVRGRDWER